MAVTEAQIRLLVGDPTGANEILATGDYTSIIALQSTNVYRAAALAARSIAGKYARLVEVTEDPTRHAMQQKFEHYAKLADDYESMANAGQGSISAATYASPIVTGSSKADIKTQRENTDRYPSAFTRGQDDNPYVDANQQTAVSSGE